MSEPETTGLPTDGEIEELPRWAVVAFAARCARRVQPLYVARATDAWARDIENIELAIGLSEDYAASAVADNAAFAAANSAALAVNAAIANANAPSKVPAALSAAIAAQSAANTAANAADDAATTDTDGDLGHAAAQDAARAASAAANAHVGSFSSDFSSEFSGQSAAPTAAMFRDFERLQYAAAKFDWTDDTPVPPEFFGPLWPMGVPGGWPRPSEVELPAQPQVLKLEIAIPAGLDKSQSDTVNAEVVKLLAAMSAADVEMGGTGLMILDECSDEPAPADEELPVQGDAFVCAGGA